MKQSVRGRHLAGLDGLRALAIIGVIAYHLNFSWASGGFLGVDLFFVLSGFLITSLLVEERLATSRVSLVSFWGRRAKRLLPALFAMLVIVIVFLALMDRRGESVSLSTLRGDALSTMFYVANWHLITTHESYFSLFASPSPLEHTWSLAIEEQYYLLFPLIVVPLLPHFSDRCRKVWWVVALTFAIASALEMAMLFHSGTDPSRVYYGTDTRAFDLLIGAALAFATAGRDPLSARVGRILDVAVWPMAMALGYFWITAGTQGEMPRDFMYRGGFVVCAFLATGLVATAALRPQSSLTKVLSLRPLVVVGVVSYGAYLWHWPIIVLINESVVPFGGLSLDLIRIALIAIFTVASYFLLERPLRRRSYTALKTGVLLPGVVAAVCAVVVMGTLPSLILPSVATMAPITPVIGVGAAGKIPGSGGFGNELPIELDRTISRQHPLRVGFIGDSLLDYSYPGIAAGLRSTGEIETESIASPGWGLVGESGSSGGLTTASPSQIASRMRSLATFRTQFHPDVVVGTWTWDNAFAAQEPMEYGRILQQAVTVLTEGVGAAKGVILVPFPTPGPAPAYYQPDIQPDLFSTQAEKAWDRAIVQVQSRVPGKVMVIPVGDSVLLNGKFTSWLPPGSWPEAPYSEWVQVRMADNTHLCQNGVVRFTSALVADFQALFGVGPATTRWVNGPWVRSLIYVTREGATETCSMTHPPSQRLLRPSGEAP